MGNCFRFIFKSGHKIDIYSSDFLIKLELSTNDAYLTLESILIKINFENEILKSTATQLSSLRCNKKSDFDLTQWSKKYVVLEKLDPTEQPIFNTGFSNIGNTCYMNSILQCLLNIDPFMLELVQIYTKHQYIQEILGKQNEMDFFIFTHFD